MKHRSKRFLGILLTLALLLGLLPGMTMTASATENSTDYTITIPATLSVANAGWNATSGITAKVKDGDTFDTGKKLTVTAESANSWALKSGDNSVGYNLATASGDYSASAEVPSWEFSADELNATSGTNKDMGIIVDDYSSKPVGSYTDTVTFTAKVEDAAPAVTLANVFENGSTTVVSFNESTYGGCTITITNSDGNYSASGGDHEFGVLTAKGAVKNGEKLIVQFGPSKFNSNIGTITLDKSDNTYSIDNVDFWSISDLTSVVVNGTDIKSQLTKK